MSKKLIITVFTVVSLFAYPLSAQQWISRLPQRNPEELSFKDYQLAFETYYKEHPVNLQLDKVKPTFRFQPGEEENTKKEIEEYKMFKRWEWFTEPRVYPGGKWDLEKIAALRAALPGHDNEMLLKQAAANPLNLKFNAGRIIWPIIKTWTPIGPSDAVGGTNMGRVNCIEFDPTNPKTVYIGAPNGGIWKTMDFGSTWSPIFDFEPTLSVGDIAIDPTNTKIIYAATSDAFGYGNPFWGGTYSVGVMKSTDGGATWAATGLSWTVGQNRTIRRLVINPSDPKILLAATSAGLYRTADAGATWTPIWNTSTYDAEFQQNNGKIAYATTTQVLKSTNAGVSFVALTATCAGARYNIEIARSNPNTLYTLCTTGVVQKSINAGASWTTVASPGVTLYGYYDNVLAVSPVSDKIVYVAGFNMKSSTNGGASWSAVPTAGHVDNHCIEFFPGSSSTIFCGNDGGLFKTTTSGSSWSSLNKGLSITQFYRGGISKTNPNIMVCGAQDNGNMKYNAGAWSNITNADGMGGFIDFSNSNNIYVTIQYGSLLRSIDGGLTWTGISTPASGSWVTPLCQDPHTANTIYAGTDKVYRSLNQGTTWTAISGILAGIGQFTVVKVSAQSSKIIYAGNGNKLYRTIDAGAHWTDITAGLPVAGNYLTDVAINDNNYNIAYVTFSGYNAGQKVYKTINGGGTWTNISGTLPNMPADCIAYENNPKNALYACTDAGVYYINDGLPDWIPYKFGLPNVIVDDLEIHYGTKKIRAITYGRGVWQAALKIP